VARKKMTKNDNFLRKCISEDSIGGVSKKRIGCREAKELVFSHGRTFTPEARDTL
jgi:hypothetical protein